MGGHYASFGSDFPRGETSGIRAAPSELSQTSMAAPFMPPPPQGRRTPCACEKGELMCRLERVMADNSTSAEEEDVIH